MYNKIMDKASNSADYKDSLLKESKFRFLLSSAFAGSFIGTGVLISFTVGAILTNANSPFTKIIMGLAFSVALSLVIFTGTELFTGNNFTMTIGYLEKKVKFSDVISVWIVSWIGNLIGALILSALFIMSGLLTKGAMVDFFSSVAAAKATMPIHNLFARAILCNFIVCLAVLICFKTENEVAKLILVIMLLFTFVVTGFEHSIANMTVFSIALLSNSITSVTLGSAVYALIIATIGNVIGGSLIVGLGFHLLKK